MKQTTKKKGFTIVELVIVIAVIGILSAVLIPTFSGLIKKANDAALQEGLRNAYTTYAVQAAETETLYSQEKVVFVAKDDATYTKATEGTAATLTLKTSVEVYVYGTDGKYTPAIDKTVETVLGEFNGYYAFVAKD